MSKVEKFIQDCTKRCSNIEYTQGVYTPSYQPWLTPDQARKAVEIAKEEVYEWLQKVSFEDYKVADEESYRRGCPYDYIDVHGLINDLKQVMKDE